MPRKQFTNSERLQLLALSRERLALGESLKSICRDLGIQPKQIRHWRAREEVIAAASGSNKSTARGRPPGSGRNTRSIRPPTVLSPETTTVTTTVDSGELSSQRPIHHSPNFDHNLNSNDRSNNLAVNNNNNDNTHTSTIASSNEQYIHRDTSQRQDLLNQCFRHTSADGFHKSGILDAAAAKGDLFRILEIGCGSGAATLDLATLLPHATITAVDTDPELIRTAQQRLQESSSAASSELLQGGEQISFLELQGEQVGTKFPSHFDVVWIRFFVIYAPDPIALLTSALQSLTSGGTLFVEAIDSHGEISDPPWMANTWLHQCHKEASLSLGANMQRGSQIGRYLHSLGSQVQDIQFDTFVPLYGKGVKLRPWCPNATTPLGALPSQEELYALGVALVKGTLETLTPTFLRCGVATQRDIDLAWKSIDQVEDDALTPYQIFSFPGGTFFQWWARKT